MMTLETSTDHFILVAVMVVLAGIIYLVQSKNQKTVIRHNISSFLPSLPRARRTPSSRTPPQSLTPEKKVPSNAPPASPYRDIFPPSTRGNLPTWAKSWKSLFTDRKKPTTEVDDNDFVTPENVIPFEQDYREASNSTYTPMGVTIGEVKTLGDFPDYSKLSGVPLPEAYKEHKLETAIPRPYRPFRWAYHQTMCRLSSPST